MAFGKNAPTRRRSKKSTLLAVRENEHNTSSNGQKELRAIRALGLTAILLGIVALVLIGIKLYDGEAADNNAMILLEAYKAKETVTPSVTVSPDPAAAIATPEPTDENYEQTDVDADANAANDANEHLVDDGSHTAEAESGEYVRPDAPETVSDLNATIEKIIAATDEDGVVGILEIPELDQELPIIGKWSYKLLKISVCRYRGPNPNTEGNLVIIGHNYKSGAHFGHLSKLSVGSELFLTDTATGTRVRYEVYQIKSVAPDAFSALKSYHGDNGLTLMTCKDNGTNRLLVRCEQKDAS